MIEVNPDIHKCSTCGAGLTQLNIYDFEGADQMAVCSCDGAGCKLCGGKGYLGEEKSPTKSKYKNKKTEIDGYKFDSEAESRYYEQLKIMQAEGRIEKFELQPKFELMPAFEDVFGEKVRAIHYIADFLVTHLNGNLEAIDVKGMETPDFLIKAKLFRYKYPYHKLSIIAEMPAKYGGGKGSFVLLSDIKKVRKEAAKNGQAKPKTPKKAKQTKTGRAKSRKGGNL